MAAGRRHAAPCRAARTSPVDEYHATARTFDPRPRRARASGRARQRAGMQYAVLTTKHHDGFALFDTKLSDFSVMHVAVAAATSCASSSTPCAPRVCASASTSRSSTGTIPTTRRSPMPTGRTASASARSPRAEQWARYLDFMFGQVRELLTNYGQIDVIWFDGGWERTGRRSGGARAARADPRAAARHPHQRPPARRGDYETPEQFVPPQPPAAAGKPA